MTVRPVILKHKKDSKGKCPIKICITIKGKRSLRTTGLRIAEEDWSGGKVKRGVANGRAINMILAAKVASVESEIFNLEATGKPVVLKTVLRHKELPNEIYIFGKKILSEKGKKKYSKFTIRRQESDLERLQKYSPNITFDEVDQSFLRKYENHLREQGLGNNTIHRIWKHFKAQFNAAKREGVTTNYPFAGYDNPKYRQSIRTFLLSDEIELIEQALKKPINRQLRTVANYFLLGCYSGLRYSEWARFDHDNFIQGDRLLLRTKKTGEIVSIPMHSRLKEVIERLRDLPKIYSEPVTNDLLKELATVAGIKKNLTTHVGRHSFSVRCAEMDISPAVTAELMGISVRTVMVYYRITNRKIDAEVQKWDQHLSTTVKP